MNIQELITMNEARLVALVARRASAVQLGDVEQVAQIDALQLETQTTLNKLNTILI